MKALLGDWQFWVVTACAGVALLSLVRGVFPGLFGRKPKGRSATLTVGGKAVGRKQQGAKGRGSK